MSGIGRTAGRTARRGLAGAVTALAALAATGGPAEADGCRDRIAAVLKAIAARDLATAGGPPLNAFIALNPSALAQAEALDAALAAGAAPGPLYCVPVAVKDNFATVDLPTTAGSLALIGNATGRDADLVAALRAAGAVVVGKTNMDELAMGVRGLSGSGGRVGNAWDTRLSSGGSSAGSGAAVGAGLVPLAVGSDNCGSLRLPAVYNGAVTLRGTYGRFPGGGVFPIGFINGVPGFIAADGEMLERAYAATVPGWDGAAAAPPRLADVRVGVLSRVGGKDLWTGGRDGADALYREALAALREAGATVVEDIAAPAFDPTLGPGFLKGAAPRVDAFLAGYPAVRRDWRDMCTSGRIRPEWTEETCLSSAAPDRALEDAARDQIDRNAATLEEALARHALDALVLPVDARGGARADASDGLTCFVAGASGLPAAALPVGLDERGMPVGLEFLGAAGSDERLVGLLRAVEAVRGALPRPEPIAADEALAAIAIPRQNALRLEIGWRARRSRRGGALGDLAPHRFRALVEDVVAGAREDPSRHSR